LEPCRNLDRNSIQGGLGRCDVKFNWRYIRHCFHACIVLALKKFRDYIRRPLVRGVRFLQQKKRLAPSTGFYADQVHPNAKLLRLLHSDTKVFIPGDEYRVADGPIPCEGDHIRDNQRVNNPFVHRRC